MEAYVYLSCSVLFHCCANIANIANIGQSSLKQYPLHTVASSSVVLGTLKGQCPELLTHFSIPFLINEERARRKIRLIESNVKCRQK